MQDLLIYSLILVPVIISLLALYQIRAARQQIVELKTQLLENKKETQALMQNVRNEAQAMGSGSIGVGQRLKEVEKKLNNTVEKQVELEQKDSGSLPYTYAIRLVEMGASSDDLVDNCSLSRVEADLIALVHSGSRKRNFANIQDTANL